ncbi:MAG: protochlorophyllide oxidoreductase [Pseudanabaena sp.]|nr:MAG: protochlorophyllide oxidoreductase [Pseudanabaena sp.]
MGWTVEAESKLKEIPFWGRFLVRREVEKFARGMDAKEVNLEVYDLANQKWLSSQKK